MLALLSIVPTPTATIDKKPAKRVFLPPIGVEVVRTQMEENNQINLNNVSNSINPGGSPTATSPTVSTEETHDR